MITQHKNEKLLAFAAGILILSILLMIIILPGAYYKTLPGTTNPGAVYGISLAILIRMSLLVGYLLIIRKSRRDRDRRKGGYIVIGVLLIVLGLIYSDGAVAFLNNEGALYISYLMFGSVVCDLIAALLTFIAISFIPKRQIK